MDIRKIKKLIELVNGSDITELEITEAENSIKIRREATTIKRNAITNTSQNSVSQQLSTNIDTEKPLLSPMVGTFYLAPTPDDEPLCYIGQKINKGEPLCIIEAMGMMNQLQAPRSGIIEAILLESGDSVEFDQPLIVIG